MAPPLPAPPAAQPNPDPAPLPPFATIAKLGLANRISVELTMRIAPPPPPPPAPKHESKVDCPPLPPDPPTRGKMRLVPYAAGLLPLHSVKKLPLVLVGGAA